MPNDQIPERGPERPRVEPEIIPPGADPRPRGAAEGGIFMRMDAQGGVHRIVITRPGWPTIVLILLVIGLIVAVVFLLLAGLLLLWIPLVVVGIVAALVSGYGRYYWRRLQ